MTKLDPPTAPVSRPRGRRALLAGLAVVLAAAAVPVIASLGTDDGRDHGAKGDAAKSVRAAVGATLASGSYDMEFTMHSTPATTPMAPARGSTSFESSGHATVNFDPYAMVITSNSSAANGIVLYVNTTTVWQGSASAPAGSPLTGIPLSSFASTVEGALGQGQGAVAMLGLASKGGYLNLEQDAVADATAAGSGSVDGTTVTYYDVTLDLTKLADDPTLTDEERTTMQGALPLLREGGYTGTTETIGIDGDGLIREITATTRYADGSSSTRHSILSNFGCAPRVYTPDQLAPPVTTTVPCAPPSTTAPATSAPTTAPATTVGGPAAAGRTAPSSTAEPPSTTPAAPSTATTEPATTEPPTTEPATTTGPSSTSVP